MGIMSKIKECFGGSDAVKEKGEAFLAANRGKTGVSCTDSGLQYKVISKGRGDKPVATDIVRVHYEGRLIDGGYRIHTWIRPTSIATPPSILL